MWQTKVRHILEVRDRLGMGLVLPMYLLFYFVYVVLWWEVWLFALIPLFYVWVGYCLSERGAYEGLSKVTMTNDTGFVSNNGRVDVVV